MLVWRSTYPTAKHMHYGRVGLDHSTDTCIQDTQGSALFTRIRKAKETLRRLLDRLSSTSRTRRIEAKVKATRCGTCRAAATTDRRDILGSGSRLFGRPDRAMITELRWHGAGVQVERDARKRVGRGRSRKARRDRRHGGSAVFGRCLRINPCCCLLSLSVVDYLSTRLGIPTFR